MRSPQADPGTAVADDVVDMLHCVVISQVYPDELDVSSGIRQFPCNVMDRRLVGNHDHVIAVAGEQSSQLQPDAARRARHHRQVRRFHAS